MALDDAKRKFFQQFASVLDRPGIGVRVKAGYMAAVSSMDDNPAKSPYPSHLPLEELVARLQVDILEWCLPLVQMEER